jgi:zinc transport system ATP-binding protein
MSETTPSLPRHAAGAPSPLVAGRGLSVSFNGRLVLDHVDIDVRPREIVTVVGLNGSGKSTLARVLLGLIPADTGEIIKRPGLVTGYVPQVMSRDATLPLTVARFVGLAGRFETSTITARLTALGIGALAEAQLATLSGGELRRALIARALIRKPDLLVLDEPMSGVDVAGQVELYRIIGQSRREQGCGILLISHDLHLVMAETDHVICLNHHVCCAGGPGSVLKDPSFAALFGQDVADALAVYRHRHDHVHDAAGHVHPDDHEHHAHG